jgi:hypothetical protein
MKRVLVVMSVLFLVAYLPGELSAQWATSGVPGEDRVTVGVFGGQLSPSTTYRDGSSFDSGTLLGGDITVWLHRNLGLRGSVSTATTDAQATPEGEPSIIQASDPRNMIYLVDARVRYPMMTGDAMMLVPYVALGGGWKEYRFERAGLYDSSRFALGLSGGSEVRFGQEGNFGLRGELRNVRSKLDLFGETGRQSDWLFSVGAVVSL